VLRGPVSSARGLINVLKMVSQDIEEQEFLKMLDDCNVDMITILEELTRISTLYYNPIINDKINFEEIVREVQNDLKHLPASDHTTVTVQQDNDIAFYSDPFIIKPILYCLIKNSMIYRDDNEQCQISISVTRESNRIKINVSDNGDGISPEFLPRVFDMFYRAHKKARGPGLGLYIVKHITEKLHGTVGIQSKQGIGTTVSIRLPLPAATA
jgi:signal transduction histidine kinase